MSFTFCEAGTVRGRQTNSGSRRYGGYGAGQQQQQQAAVTDAPAITPKEYLDKKSGFSTFGIIAIIFVVIVGCLAFYYGIMCYPFLCRDEKKYHFMDVSSTITAATSRSIQSIENYPDDQKHNVVLQNEHRFKWEADDDADGSSTSRSKCALFGYASKISKTNISLSISFFQPKQFKWPYKIFKITLEFLSEFNVFVLRKLDLLL